MVRRAIRGVALLAGLVMGWSLAFSGSFEAQGQQFYSLHASPDLFYNYYVPPSTAGGPGAAMYPSPRPTPPWVGHTWVTYQPLMPHEFLYPHHRTYRRLHADGKQTRVIVTWQ